MYSRRFKVLCGLVVLVFCGCHPFQDTADHPFGGGATQGNQDVQDPQDSQGGDTFDPTDGTTDSTTDNPDFNSDAITSDDTTDPSDTFDPSDTGDLDDVPDIIDPPVGSALHVWSGRPDGAQGTGTREDPFLTLADALLLANEKLAQEPSEQVLIFMAQGHYNIPAELLGDPEALSGSINFTGIHFFGGIPEAADGASVLWDAVPDDAARSAIKLKSPSEPMVFRPREALTGFEGTELDHVELYPDPGLLDVIPDAERVMVYVVDSTVRLRRTSVEVGLAAGYSVGLMVDTVNSRQGLLVLEDSEVRFPQTLREASGDFEWLMGVKTHGGLVRLTRSKVSFETPSMGDAGQAFQNIVGVFATEDASRVEMLQSRITTGFAIHQSIGLHCESGCDINVSGASVQAVGRDSNDRRAENAVGISLLMAGQAAIDQSRINMPDSGGVPTCMAQGCIGILVWGSAFLPPTSQLAVGPQPNTSGPISNCDKTFFGLIVEGSRVGGGNTVSGAVGIEVITNDENTGGFPPLVCVNASRIDAGQCGISNAEFVDAHCRGVRLTYPLATIIHNSIIYGGEAASKSAAVEIAVGGTYRNVILASNLLHGGSSIEDASAAILLDPSLPGVFDNDGDLTSGVVILGNDLYAGESNLPSAAIEQLPSQDSSLLVLAPLALMSNAFHSAEGSTSEIVYKRIVAGQLAYAISAEALNGTLPETESVLNRNAFCSEFSPGEFRAQPSYVPLSSPGNPCQNEGLPYSLVCLGDNPPNGVLGWLPWGDMLYKPRVCNILGCNVTGTCSERWSGDHRPDIGPFESEGEACICAQ